MARPKRGVTARAKHKKVLKKAKGYYGAKSRHFRSAQAVVIKSGQYAYRDRRVKKREFRALWIHPHRRRIQRIWAWPTADLSTGSPRLASPSIARSSQTSQSMTGQRLQPGGPYKAQLDPPPKAQRYPTAAVCGSRRRAAPFMVFAGQDRPHETNTLDCSTLEQAKTESPQPPTRARWKRCASNCLGKKGRITDLMKQLASAGSDSASASARRPTSSAVAVQGGPRSTPATKRWTRPNCTAPVGRGDRRHLARPRRARRRSASDHGTINRIGRCSTNSASKRSKAWRSRTISTTSPRSTSGTCTRRARCRTRSTSTSGARLLRTHTSPVQIRTMGKTRRSRRSASSAGARLPLLIH